MTSPRLRSAAVALSLALAVLTGTLAGTTGHASTLPARGSAVSGADISWPNCPKGMGIPQRPTLGLPMPLASAKYVIIGLTNGPGFTPNPCLARQIAWVKARHLWLGVYSVVSYPTAAQLRKYGGTGTLRTRLHRVGVAQARFNLATMRKAGLARAPMVWVDVEPVRSAPWSSSTRNNNAVIDGAMLAYRVARMHVGLYSYRYGWKEITGGRRLPTVSTWVPLSTCSKPSFSGGPILLTQTTSNSRDLNKTCPGRVGPSRFRVLFKAT